MPSNTPEGIAGKLFFAPSALAPEKWGNRGFSNIHTTLYTARGLKSLVETTPQEPYPKLEDEPNVFCGGMQLFLDKRFRTRIVDGKRITAYRDAVIMAIERHGFSESLLLHLPDRLDNEGFDIEAAAALAEAFPKMKPFIHYDPDVSTPQINGKPVGYENGAKGFKTSFEDNKAHVSETLAKTREEETFFVFDIGRLTYDNTENQMFGTRQEVAEFIAEIMGQLDPNQDVLHINDKTTWHQHPRDARCIVGEGILAKSIFEDGSCILDLVCEFIYQGGVVVPEYETLAQTAQSFQALIDYYENVFLPKKE